jgi:hypothetical protein
MHFDNKVVNSELTRPHSAGDYLHLYSFQSLLLPALLKHGIPIDYLQNCITTRHLSSLPAIIARRFHPWHRTATSPSSASEEGEKIHM